MMTLKNKAEFDFVYKYARKYSSETFNLYVLNLSYPSLSQKPFSFKERKVFSHLSSIGQGGFLGLSVSKKIGNSPQRNKIKRRFRAIFRNNQSCFKHLAVIFMAKEGSVEVDYLTLQEKILKGINFKKPPHSLGNRQRKTHS